MTTGDPLTDAMVVVGALAVCLLVLVVGYGVLSAFPEASERLASWLFDR